MKKALLGLAAMAAVASPAAAADVLYQNNFDGENGGETALNYTSFDGLTVVDGTVDLVHTGDGFNISCVTGGCVDLDGSTNDAGVLLSGAFGFDSSKLYTLGFKVSGSQVGGTTLDGVTFGFLFDDLTSGEFTFSSSSGALFGGTFENEPGVAIFGSQFPADYPYDTLSLSFRGNRTGTFSFFINGDVGDPENTVNDNIGMVLDDVSLVSAAVPEPATWAMMIMGFGFIGAALRRAKPKVTVAFA